MWLLRLKRWWLTRRNDAVTERLVSLDAEYSYLHEVQRVTNASLHELELRMALRRSQRR